MNNQRKKLCLDYLKARKAFRDAADKDAVLNGNDNIVGRIGEAIAHSFLEQLNRKPSIIKHQSNPGYDIICDHDIKVSVKMITHENKTGGTSKIKSDWDELIGIELGENLEVINFGTITKDGFIEEQQRKNQSLEPYFNRRMFNDNGIFTIAGKLFPKDEIETYNLL